MCVYVCMEVAINNCPVEANINIVIVVSDKDGAGGESASIL